MQVWIVDTFADDQYAGNPAGVVMQQDGFPPTAEMQSTALHLGLPTTAFVVAVGPQQYEVRWFTPKEELNICGHATLACAAYLYESDGISGSSELCFHTRSGPLYARRMDRYISLDLPLMDVITCKAPIGLEEALGADILYCARAIDDLLIEVESENIVAKVRPNFEELGKMPGRGLIVTARADKERADFVSRSFFPALGVNEDQVCVSAHCKLGPYWARKLAKRRLSAVQMSARGGRLLLEVTRERVHVAGTSVVRPMSCDSQKFVVSAIQPTVTSWS